MRMLRGCVIVMAAVGMVIVSGGSLAPADGCRGVNATAAASLVANMAAVGGERDAVEIASAFRR